VAVNVEMGELWHASIISQPSIVRKLFEGEASFSPPFFVL
jgi:hypothetical protein